MRGLRAGVLSRWPCEVQLSVQSWLWRSGEAFPARPAAGIRRSVLASVAAICKTRARSMSAIVQGPQDRHVIAPPVRAGTSWCRDYRRSEGPALAMSHLRRSPTEAAINHALTGVATSLRLFE